MEKAIFNKTTLLAIMAVLSCAMLAPMCAAAESLPTIYGSMSDNRTWSAWDRAEGIYSFQPVEGTAITPVYTDGWDLAATGGGVLVDDIYHLFNYREGSSSMFCIGYTSYHIEDWSVDYSCYFSNVILSNDMTYDPVTDKVYCARRDGKLVQWDPNNIDNVNTIGTFGVEIVAIASTGEGELYGIGTDGNFYNINKGTGALTKIGVTGIQPKGYQSAVFDYSTNTLYWAAYTKSSKSSLYKIDITTGAAEKIFDFADNARFCGLYITGSATDSGAPAAVDNFTVTFPHGSNDGTVTFTMPTTTFGGDALSGQMHYKLEIDDVEAQAGDANAGEQVSMNVTVASGEHKFTLVVSNAAGESPRSKSIIYVGKAKPGYVDYAKAEHGDQPGQIRISWKAPEYGMPDGAYFDPSELRYNVVRQPDGVLVGDHIAECEMVDVIDYNGELSVFKYEITPYIDDIAGFISETNGVALGNPLMPPYDVAMVDANLDLFTIIDANHDGTSWCKDWYGYGVSCGGRWDGACDDWLILPPLHLDNGGVYHVIINVGNDYDGPSKWELKMGRAPKADSMTQQLMSQASTTQNFEGDIRVTESGTYYIGIHCIGSAGTTMFVTNIIVRDEANYDAPDAPINVSGVGAERGELAAYVTFTTPSMTIGGDRLDALTAVNIYHGEKLVYTLNDVEPDCEYTCKVEADQEFNEYSVAAVNEYGEGRRARIEYVFAGYDYPAFTTNVVLSEDENGTPKLTWDPASDVGLYGYYVNPEDVTYEIYRGYGNNSYDLVAEGLQGEVYLDTDLELDCDQFLLNYYVYPVNSIGRGYGTSSNSECFGRPFVTPFVDAFPNGQSAMHPWHYRSNNPQSTGWSIIKNTDTTIEDYDMSDGMMAFFSSTAGDQSTLVSPYVTVKGQSNPVLDFYYYKGAMLTTPQITVNGVVLANEAQESGTQGWQHYFASLRDFAVADRIRIELEATSLQGETYAFVDHIRVRQAHSQDLAVANLIVPEKMTIGETSHIGVVVKNDGTTASETALLKVYRNGYVVETAEIASLKSAEKLSFDFEEKVDVAFGDSPVYVAEIVYDIDQDMTNNNSDQMASSIKLPRYPAPDHLRAEADDLTGAVSLSWDAPDTSPLAPDAITEDFEGYESFAIEMEPWQLVDGDKHTTSIMSDPLVWYEDLDYPHCGEPMAYQIFDPNAVGIDCNEYPAYTPHSGEKSVVCWSTSDWSVDNDDWLISPELFAGGQTISFYVYSRTGYFDNEKYEVLYSSKSSDVKDFELLMSGSAINEWTIIEVALPSDAKYFAIHTVSSQSNTEIWYDDITYIPATLSPITLDIVGYNIYRDNVKINSQPVDALTFVDADAEAGQHKYNVTTVYGVGESVLSDDVTATVVSGIGDVRADGKISVLGGKGEIRVVGANGQSMSICAVNGMTIHRDNVSATDYKVRVPAGVYIVNVDGDTFKVIVR